MSILSAIPVEIWHEILQAVIHVPFVLDTTVSTEGCFWHDQSLYHDKRPYIESENQRKLLRLVCKSWKAFADENQFRWITYDSGYSGLDTERKEAEMALSVPRPEISKVSTSRPRRILLNVTRNEDLGVFRRTIDNFGSKLNTLFVDCSDKYGAPIFEHLIAQSSMLPSLRCLMLKAINFRSNPLQVISRAFPKLTGLTLERGLFPHNPDDCLSLPQLESLYFDFRFLVGITPETWKMPELVRLSLPLSDNQDEKAVVFRFLKSHGRKLVFLHLSCNIQANLSSELWNWCPSLTEIATSFSRVLLGGPIPTTHPLKYLVHFVDAKISIDWSDNRTYSDGTEDQNVPAIIRNIRLLPPNFSTFVVAVTSWSDESERSAPIGESELFWQGVHMACQERHIRLEDEHRSTFDECFLVS
jgi:hypothetical protein